MASHPYISGPGSVVQMIGYLRKNFPVSVSSETVKKFSLAPNNESYVINALQFIGVLDEKGKRTKIGHDVFVLGEDAFQSAFEGLIRDSYKDLFEIRGDDAWSLGRQDLISYFRTTDKTSEVIGGRQAGLFQAFRTLAGHAQANETSPKNGVPKTRQMKTRATSAKRTRTADVVIDTARSGDTPDLKHGPKDGRREMAMTVRIEINLPAGGTQETYDAIFKSIRANLIDE
ncbi:DUF5343 domain-containing protein [Sphingobium sp. AP49]|uniref:DUF5343 domain-containing protein n=1 Tax=Sphingobium sp. AP49 TaxID=1144307 RepID=UPI0012F63BB9|nr:DUF5343 domain-containing protein [Sphingobium sp. AP49]WHO38856.1 DUF5343 domain-containing protein [Sphingobium sp. AP49]